MKPMRVMFLFVIAVLALSHQSDGQQARPLAEQLRLAGVVPRGALVYLQVRDLGALMGRWTASPTHEAFYNSASFKRFQLSNIYLKLQDRKEDFEKVLGFGIDESRLAELAGGASAVGLYDIGSLEMIFITEVGREKAFATTLFTNKASFEERPSKNGAYFVREVTTDGGRLKQQFCFAYADSKLIVTTTEGLMIRALNNVGSANAGDDSQLTDVLTLANTARGFVARDLTLWLDQTKLNRSRHFKSYWLYDNVAEGGSSGDSLAGIESGLVDLRFSPEGLNEQRWFKLNATSQSGARKNLTSEQATAFMKFAPRTAQLIEMSASTDGLSQDAALTLFGKDFDETYNPETASSDSESSESSDSGESSANRRAQRYSRLDARFDRDVDDPQMRDKEASRFAKKEAAKAARPSAATKLEGLLNPAASFATLARSRSEAGKPFVRFERAVVIEMKSALDRAALERVVTSEMRDRFVVSGINPQLVWQDEGGVRYLAQTLIEQGAAYAVSGKYLVLASSRELVRDILAAAAVTSAPAARVEGAADYYAVVRIGDAKPIFDKLMAKLDGKIANRPVSQNKDDEDGESEAPEIKFFSDNLSSLITATTIREIRLRRASEGGLITERLTYTW